MPTLTIETGPFDTAIKLKGLSFKKLNDSEVERNIYFDRDINCFFLETSREINGRTANVKSEFLIKCLKEIKEYVFFDKIKIIGRYEMTGEELMNEINKND